ncbi:hypothetical protein VC83_07081 [Pseudogymnoascus destructans]|uniref:Threonylcarbamoyl-AMP synthase n=1 Tax=Pseudogymnoascus destructans TaxID=655981 RepID=A0A177A3D2_9PEZI|nr:uncharacterized protein VC83_07081 [Pseudogymnoascus destructans]OAF56775.1 hypothetical protein VC83_07081 [Pseudogymnoascus destructans]
MATSAETIERAFAAKATLMVYMGHTNCIGHSISWTRNETLSKITKDGTTAMFISSSPLLKEICRLNYELGQIMVGSSANLSGGGQKFRVEDIEDEVKEAADLIVD